MIIFNSDLDNTLIFSYRRKLPAEHLCVERHHDRDFSFMTKYSYELLLQIRQKLCFVPTTTRSEEQYRRIRFGGGEPEYALVCNGGILLKDGVRDESWYEETLQLVSQSQDAIKMAVRLLEGDQNRSYEIRHLENLFLFTKSRQPEETVEALKCKLDPEKADVFSNRDKIYVLPKNVNKGVAALRLKKRLGGQRLLAAGDSLMDIPLLSVADRSILPSQLVSQMEKKSNITVFEGDGVFSDHVLDFIAGELGV